MLFRSNLLIRALRQQGRIDVLSRPQVMTLDNQFARVFVGQNFPIVLGSNVTATGIVSNNITYTPVGVELDVTPKISPDNKVLLRVTPQVSSTAPTNVSLGNGVTATAINQQLVDTTVVLVDATVVVVDATVVLVVATVVVVVPPPPAQPPDTQASQQLDCVPTQALPPEGAVHALALLLTLHVVAPVASVWQQVTARVCPHVELPAQDMTTSAHSLETVPAWTALFVTLAAHLTYAP